MNCIFNFRRFLKVFRKDIRDSIRRNWSLPLIFICIYVLLWGLNTFAMGKVTTLEGRTDYFFILAAVFCLIIPSSLYGMVNDRRDGVLYALLPASMLEKYTAMLVVSTVLWPAGYLLLQACADYLLSLAGGPQWGYSGNIFSGTPSACRHPASLVMYVTFFACGTLLFRTRRTAKSLTVVMVIVLASGMLRRLCPDGTLDGAGHIMPFIVTPVLWIAGYRLFRRIEY